MDLNSHFLQLRQRLEKRNKNLREKLSQKHKEAFAWAIDNTRQLAAGAMGSVMLLSSPAVQLLPSPSNAVVEGSFEISSNTFLVSDLAPLIPDDINAFSKENEMRTSEILSQYFGMSVKPDINGFRLNNTVGVIGAEQHLMRYPGDTMEGHFSTSLESEKYYSSGMAPGRGAYGYFAPSRSELTQEAIDREKYYLAVQTFLVPEYSTRTREYIDFFKFRKMLVVNPSNGKAIVAVIGDAGPAVWTGKQLGGSPEVMKHLERVDGKARGKVLYFFIDDPENKVPLGPIEPKKQEA